MQAGFNGLQVSLSYEIAPCNISIHVAHFKIKSFSTFDFHESISSHQLDLGLAQLVARTVANGFRNLQTLYASKRDRRN